MPHTTERDYLYASGRIRALEGQLLTRDLARRMIEARTNEEAFSVLGECGDHTPISSTEALERLLSAERSRVFESMEKMLPDSVIVDVFRARYDMHNIKVLLKSASTAEDVAALLIDSGRIPAEKLIEVFHDNSPGKLPEEMAQALAQGREIMAHTGDPQMLDIALDKALLHEMHALSAETGDSFLGGYVRLLIDVYNLKTLIRARRMEKSAGYAIHFLAPEGNVPLTKLKDCYSDSALENAYRATPLETAAQTGISALRDNKSLTVLERICDNACILYLYSARLLAFGSPLVTAYLAAKEFETANLRTIFTGRFSGLAPERIQERIRDCYV